MREAQRHTLGVGGSPSQDRWGRGSVVVKGGMDKGSVGQITYGLGPAAGSRTVKAQLQEDGHLGR